MVRAQFDPRLVEEAVLLRIESGPAVLRREFRHERDALYETRDAEARDREFDRLHERWFGRFDLGAPVFAALREHGLDLRNVSGVFVLSAVSAKEEGADLHASTSSVASGRHPLLATGTPPPSRWAQGCPRRVGLRALTPRLVIRLRPVTLASGETVLPLLRPELLHVADMLDPSFAYERTAAESGERPIAELRKARYRVLWDTTIDGRLFNRGLLSPGAVARRRSEFSLLFPESPESKARFRDLLHGPRPSHAELWKEAVRS